jgi:hypothetical protein
LEFYGGKGKEREPPLLKLGLKWTGRIPKAEQLGLPTRRPGKMFRADINAIPLTPEEKVSDERRLE